MTSLSNHTHVLVLVCAALAGGVTSGYSEGSAFLRELGFDNPAEIARVLDIAMNPKSLFVTFRDKKRATNSSVRSLPKATSTVPPTAPVILHPIELQAVPSVLHIP